MKKYTPDVNTLWLQGQMIGANPLMVEDENGTHVPAEVAERLYKALTWLRDAASEAGGVFTIAGWHFGAYVEAESALNFADEYGGGSDE